MSEWIILHLAYIYSKQTQIYTHYIIIILYATSVVLLYISSDLQLLCIISHDLCGLL